MNLLKTFYNGLYLLEVENLDIAEKAETVRRSMTLDNLTTFFNGFINTALNKIIDIIIAIIIWKVSKYLVKWILKFAEKAMDKTSLDKGVHKFLCSVIKFSIYAVVALVILDLLGIQTASLIAVFGSAALALSMSLQGSLSNIAGGILILVFRPFTLGDYIISGDTEGIVVSIDMLYTKIRTLDGKTVMMPNGALSNSNIANVGSQGYRMLQVPVGISYTADIEKAKKIMYNIALEYPNKDDARGVSVVVKSLDESSVTLSVRCFLKFDDYYPALFYFNEKIKTEFDANGIEIPFNQLDVHITKD